MRGMTPFNLGLKLAVRVLALGSAMSCSPYALAERDDWPEHALDLDYGKALYEFHQADYFAALTTLNVAKERGGIQRHGDHPALIEGSLLLSYGMVHEAKAIFEQVLKEDIPQETRNQAWFYLGKVFYLEASDEAARDALKRVSAIHLQEQNEALYHDYLYLMGQLELRKDGVQDVGSVINSLPEAHLGRIYLAYNQALQQIAEGSTDKTITDLTALKPLIPKPTDALEAAEAKALRERIALSLADLHLQRAEFAQAMSVLQDVSFDSPFTGLALFNFAVSAANQKQYGLALQALQKLKKLPLFTPWLQQVPFALAFVYERLGKEQLAFQSYRDAADHYEKLHQELVQRRTSLTEQDIVAAMAPRDDLTTPVTLGDCSLQTDSFGRIKTQPRDVAFATMLADERFQQALKELHELYKLRDSLHEWDNKLDTFSFILDTRKTQRAEGLVRTRAAMEAQQADQWQAQYQDLKQALAKATEQEDVHYFMSQEQIDHYHQIQKVYRTLDLLPPEQRDEYAERIRRIDAHFKWTLYDTFSRNRWQVAKPLHVLDREMAAFNAGAAKLNQEMASDERNIAFAQRVQAGHARLDDVRAELEQALAQSRERLLDTVRAELKRQEGDTLAFLKSSRQAQARLADSLYRQSQMAKPNDKSPEAPEIIRKAQEVQP